MSVVIATDLRSVFDTWRPSQGNPLTGELVVNSWYGDERIVTNSNLHPHEWMRLDSEIHEATREHRFVHELFASEGLIDTSSTLAEQVRVWTIAGQRKSAAVSMSGKNTVLDSTPRIERSVPIPILRADYQLNERDLLTSRRMGRDIDVTEAEESAEAVALKREEMYFTGLDVDIDGSKVWGVLNHPKRFNFLPDNFSNDELSFPDLKNFRTIHSFFVLLLAQMRTEKFRGPFGVLVGTDVYTLLNFRYEDGTARSVMSDLLALAEIKWINESPFMPADEIVFIQLNKKNIQAIEAQAIDNRQYGSPDQMSHNYMVYCAVSLKISPDFNNTCGIAHVTKCLG